MYRTNKGQRLYDEYLNQTQNADCPFCNAAPGERTVIEDTPHIQVITNIFPYEFWEGFKATEHLLLLPKRHVSAFNRLTPAERQEAMDLYCKYEGLGYNLYSRAPSSGARTQGHAHSHFIKIEGQVAQKITFTQTPYSLKVSW